MPLVTIKVRRETIEGRKETLLMCEAMDYLENEVKELIEEETNRTGKRQNQFQEAQNQYNGINDK